MKKDAYFSLKGISVPPRLNGSVEDIIDRRAWEKNAEVREGDLDGWEWEKNPEVIDGELHRRWEDQVVEEQYGNLVPAKVGGKANAWI